MHPEGSRCYLFFHNWKKDCESDIVFLSVCGRKSNMQMAHCGFKVLRFLQWERDLESKIFVLLYAEEKVTCQRPPEVSRCYFVFNGKRIRNRI